MPYPVGTCKGCGLAVAPGRARCWECLAERRAQEAAKRAERKRNHQCPACGAAKQGTPK